ncbi:MAG: hypothetical protein AAB817_00550 [Patescibacteria group bacterium]
MIGRRDRAEYRPTNAGGNGGGPTSPEKLIGPEEMYAMLREWVAGIDSPKVRPLFERQLNQIWEGLNRDAKGKVVVNDAVMALINLHYDWTVANTRPEAIIAMVKPIILQQLQQYSQELRSAKKQRQGEGVVPEHRRIFERYVELCRDYQVELETAGRRSWVIDFLRDEGWLPKQD